jgi:hypothetical protein
MEKPDSPGFSIMVSAISTKKLPEVPMIGLPVAWMATTCDDVARSSGPRISNGGSDE